MSRRARIIALAAIMLVAGIAVTVVLVQSGGHTANAAGSGVPVGFTTATVERRTLTERSTVDGTLGFAESIESAGTTELGETPLPSLEEIAANPEFRPTWIAKEEFERAWSKRLSQVVHASRSSSGEGSKGDEFTPN